MDKFFDIEQAYRICSRLSEAERKKMIAALQERQLPFTELECYAYKEAPGCKHLFFYREGEKEPIPYFQLDRDTLVKVMEVVRSFDRRDSMKVSVITSCYNRAETIRGAIESVLAQDYPDIEFIVVDGASTDGSTEIIREYEGRISVIVSEPDHGMYEAINKGIRLATGDVIGLLHSDDFFYDNGVVTRIVERMKRTQADFLYGDGLFVNPEHTDKVVRNWIGGSYRLWKVRHGWLPLHPTCYIRREVMLRLGLYNESYQIAADTDLLVRYLVTGGLTVTYLREYIVRMRMGGLSTDSAKRKKMWDEDIRVYGSHGFSPMLTKIEKMAWKVPQFIKALVN